MIERRLALRGPINLGQTLGPMRHGLGDRTIVLKSNEAWIAMRPPSGGGTIHIQAARDAVRAQAWGDGAAALLEALPDLIGEGDRPEGLVAHHRVVRELQRRHPGLRLPRSRAVLHALVPSVFEQKVTGIEAFRAYAALLRRHGEPAPGPAGLLLPPAAETLAGLPYHAFHPLGIERRRAEVIRRAATRAAWLEAATDPGESARRLRSLPGIGVWTAAEVVRIAFGDPDAVSVGDYHVPSMVSWALAGEPRADDARMLELLEPYRGQRGRVQRLLEVGRIMPPRYGPRRAPRRIAAI